MKVLFYIIKNYLLFIFHQIYYHFLLSLNVDLDMNYNTSVYLKLAISSISYAYDGL